MRDALESLFYVLLTNNEGLQMAIIGHVVAPPPVFDDTMKPLPSAGRIMIDEFIHATNTGESTLQ